MLLFTIFIFYVVSLVNALPITKRIVVSPHITNPDGDTVWTPGIDELVKWYSIHIVFSVDAHRQL
jgi:hypothetical protein